MKQVRIVGTGMTRLGRLGLPAADLSAQAVTKCLDNARLQLDHLGGLVAVPSISNPHFMQAHHLATKMGVFPKKDFVLRTIDTGGAGPISALTTASVMIRNDWADVVVVVGGDAVLSLDSEEFMRRADGSVLGGDLPSPCIPNGYDRYAQWHLKKTGMTREQLAMVTVISSHLAAKHPDAMCKKPVTLEEVLASRPVGEVTNVLECARRADGACAVVLASTNFYKALRDHKPLEECPVVVSTGEASGPLYPPPMEEITSDLFSCDRAATIAYRQAQLGPADIDFFGLYDCFPICLVRALESTRVCKKGEAGELISKVYNKLQLTGEVDTKLWPVNTHGGLQCFGAPWEVPAMYNIVEAVKQLSNTAGARQIAPKPRRALVYGNGGIFSASSVAILGDGAYEGGRRNVE